MFKSFWSHAFHSKTDLTLCNQSCAIAQTFHLYYEITKCVNASLCLGLYHSLLMISFLYCSSDMSGASNTLAREFLTDVHQLCSAVAQRAEAREEDEEESHMVALGEYLVRGRGFLLLSTLDSIIDQVSMFNACLHYNYGF